MFTKAEIAYNKIDHTLCMNANEGTLKFNLDKPEDYLPDGDYDPEDTDCKDVYDMIQCLDTINETIKGSKLAEIVKPFLRVTNYVQGERVDIYWLETYNGIFIKELTEDEYLAFKRWL